MGKHGCKPSLRRLYHDFVDPEDDFFIEYHPKMTKALDKKGKGRVLKPACGKAVANAAKKKRREEQVAKTAKTVDKTEEDEEMAEENSQVDEGDKKHAGQHSEETRIERQSSSASHKKEA